MWKINIKPLSVNKVWQGRRFKTPYYKAYEQEVMLMLPKDLKIPSGRLGLALEVGFSNKQSDIDNVAKPFIDILQKQYKFNDRDLYQLKMDKVIVPKKEEYIQFMVYAL